jgi:hypothetical protein
MNWNVNWAGENEDPVVEQALRNFKASVNAWSEAAMRRPRPVMSTARLHGWRLAAGWALGCAVAAASVGGALYEREHQQQLARIAAARAAQKAAPQKLVNQQDLDQQLSAAQSDQDLLANVDSDISRAVPAAMEPLAQMMDEKQADNNGTQ